MKLIGFPPLPYLLVLGALFMVSSCVNDPEPDPFEPSAVAEVPQTQLVDWYGLLLELVQYTPGMRPPVVARNAGYIGLSVYESLAPGMGRFQTLSGRLKNWQRGQNLQGDVDWELVVNANMAANLRNFFPTAPQTLLDKINQEEINRQVRLSRNISPAVEARSIQWGRSIADQVFRWSATDVFGHELFFTEKLFPISYLPPSGPGFWQPTPPDFTPALLPYFGQCRTFVSNLDAALPPPPHPYSLDASSPFYKEAEEVYLAWKQLTPEQFRIAYHWSDDIPGQTAGPAGRMIQLALQEIQDQRVHLENAAVILAQTGMALNDAAVIGWWSKYQYNVMRPIAFISAHIDPEFRVVLPVTPSFPDYVSGHSIFGAAGAGILERWFGASKPVTDRTHEGLRLPEIVLGVRSFPSYKALAYENAISRIYGGVHFRKACEEGYNSGLKIAALVHQLPWEK